MVSLLRRGARLLTLTGPGGTGKMRLGIEAASELVSEFKAGVFWVGVATLKDPALVTDMIGQTLGATESLADHIAERELLLLLDNLEHIGEGQITVRLHQNDADRKRKFNRTENVRPIPPSDPDFPRLYGRRNDSESLNRSLEDTLFLGRAHSLGWRRQQVEMLGWALMVNAMTMARHRAAEDLEAA